MPGGKTELMKNLPHEIMKKKQQLELCGFEGREDK